MGLLQRASQAWRARRRRLAVFRAMRDLALVVRGSPGRPVVDRRAEALGMSRGTGGTWRKAYTQGVWGQLEVTGDGAPRFSIAWEARAFDFTKRRPPCGEGSWPDLQRAWTVAFRGPSDLPNAVVRAVRPSASEIRWLSRQVMSVTRAPEFPRPTTGQPNHGALCGRHPASELA